MELWQLICLATYCLIVTVLAIYGFHRYILLRLFHRHHNDDIPPPVHSQTCHPSPCNYLFITNYT